MADGDNLKTDEISIELVTSSGVAYAVGDVIDTCRKVTWLDGKQPETFKINRVTLFDRDMQNANVDVAFLNSSPISGTFTDNAAVSMTDQMGEKIIDIVHLYDHTSLTASGMSRSGQLDIPVRLRSLAAGDGLCVIPIAQQARTHASVGSLVLKLGITKL